MASGILALAIILLPINGLSEPGYFDCRNLADATDVVLHYKIYDALHVIMVGKAKKPYQEIKIISFGRKYIAFRFNRSTYSLNRQSHILTQHMSRGVVKLACLPGGSWPEGPPPDFPRP